MNSVRVDSLMPNMNFTEPVFLDDTFILLTPETTVDEALIERLKKWNYTVLYTHGVPAGRSEVVKQEEPEKIEYTLDEDIQEKNDKEQIVKFYFDLLNFTKELFTTFLSKNELMMGTLTEKIKVVIENVKKHKDFWIDTLNCIRVFDSTLMR